ncbi:MAG: DNA topoisomerase IB [Bacteroidia bacterium]
MPWKPTQDIKLTTRKAGLRYYSDDRHGYSRTRHGRGFIIYDREGNRVADQAEKQRIKKLAIPPAWERVWISPLPHGHLQATGFDAKGRKQYLYHELWNEFRNKSKFGRMREFGKALPKIRQTTEEHLRKRGLPREKVLACVVQLLEHTQVRVGNQEYAQKNESYGLTTLRDKHVKEQGRDKITFEFKGKSGKQNHISLDNPRLARLVKMCKDIPGYELFQYYDDKGKKHAIDSGEVNEYIREISGHDFTAKDFRTWGGTVWATKCYCEIGPCEDEKSAEKNTVQVIKMVASHLRNTTAICRKYYVHPSVVEAYRKGELEALYRSSRQAAAATGLTREEQAVMKVLQKFQAKT